MNVYQINVEPKAIGGSGIGHIGTSRTFAVVTTSAREAMNIAQGKISDKEEISGCYELSKDCVVDYSHVTGQNC